MSAATVLVVDDNEEVRKLLDMVLPPSGFAVLTASNGEEAVHLYEEHRDTISLVLLDVQMPKMDGPSTLVALRQIDPHIRCCFMSGYTGNYLASDLLRLGVSHVLPKPFPSLAELTQTLWETADLPKPEA